MRPIPSEGGWGRGIRAQNTIYTMLKLQTKIKPSFPKIFHLKFQLQVRYSFLKLYRVPMRFISSTYTTVITNLECNFLINKHVRSLLFSYPWLMKYSLRRFYHICPSCFIPYSECLKQIERVLCDPELFESISLSPSGTFM